MMKGIRYELITVKKWCQEDDKLFILTEDNKKIEYLGKHQDKVREGRTLYVAMVKGANPSCMFTHDLMKDE